MTVIGKINNVLVNLLQLVNHGVSSLLLDKLKMGIQEFFELPMEEKRKFWQGSEDVEGFGQAFVVSEDQNLDWGDMFFMVTLPKHMRKPHLFPKLPRPQRSSLPLQSHSSYMLIKVSKMQSDLYIFLPCRDVLEEYSSEVKKLALAVLTQMAKALKMEEEQMREMFSNGMQSMRMNYYPRCPEPEKVIGLSPHSDGGGLTILLQVNEVEGLQIRKEGKWVPIKPLPNAFIINIGDMLEVSATRNVHQKFSFSIRL